MHNFYVAHNPQNYTYTLHTNSCGYTFDPCETEADSFSISSSSTCDESSASTDINSEPRSRDWNKQFQEYLCEPDPNVKYRKLSKLAKDFVSIAEEYGRFVHNDFHNRSNQRCKDYNFREVFPSCLENHQASFQFRNRRWIKVSESKHII